jgi:hypothetical protein
VRSGAITRAAFLLTDADVAIILTWLVTGPLARLFGLEAVTVATAAAVVELDALAKDDVKTPAWDYRLAWPWDNGQLAGITVTTAVFGRISGAFDCSVFGRTLGAGATKAERLVFVGATFIIIWEFGVQLCSCIG